MTGRPHVAFVVVNPFSSDSRVWKLARSCVLAGYDVTVAAHAEEGLPAREDGDGFTVHRIPTPPNPRWLPAPRLPGEHEENEPKRLATRLRRRVVNTVGRVAQSIRFLVLARRRAAGIAAVVPAADIWQAEGLIALPVVLELRRRRGGKAVYDARDIDTESGRLARLPPVWQRLLQLRERRWVRAADAFVTVSPEYASVLARTTGRRPAIVMNVPLPWTPPDPPERLYHRVLGLPPTERVVLYLGQVVAHRGIEELQDAIARIADAVLVIAGFGPDYERYRARAAALPHADRIHFLPAVAPSEVPRWTAAADISAMPVQGDTLNHRLNTPTKLFDAMGAGVPVVASDLPGLARIVRETGCGVLCDPSDPADIARAICEIVDAPPARRDAMRTAGLAAARGPYSWASQVKVLFDIYGGLGVAPPHGTAKVLSKLAPEGRADRLPLARPEELEAGDPSFR